MVILWKTLLLVTTQNDDEDCKKLHKSRLEIIKEIVSTNELLTNRYGNLQQKYIILLEFTIISFILFLCFLVYLYGGFNWVFQFEFPIMFKLKLSGYETFYDHRYEITKISSRIYFEIYRFEVFNEFYNFLFAENNLICT